MRRKSTLILLILLFFSACQNSQKEKAFRAKYQDVPMNVELQFWKPTEKFVFGELFSLELENFSTEKIVFSFDHDVTILTFERGEWIEILNNAIYFPPDIDSQISPKGPDLPGVISIGLSPQINRNTSAPVEIRIVVVGYFYRNDEKTDDKIGAYIDVRLEP